MQRPKTTADSLADVGIRCLPEGVACLKTGSSGPWTLRNNGCRGPVSENSHNATNSKMLNRDFDGLELETPQVLLPGERR